MLQMLNPYECYFSLFTCFFTWPNLLFDLGGLIRYFRRHFLLFIVANGAVFLAVKHLTIVHPYTLADNRHIVFYAWRLMDKFRYPLVPVYTSALFIMVYSLPKVCSITSL